MKSLLKLTAALGLALQVIIAAVAFSDETDRHSLYERVRPGITGLWQISGRSQTTFAERVSYDEWYIKNWTVWYDLVIMLQTVWVLLRGQGAY